MVDRFLLLRILNVLVIICPACFFFPFSGFLLAFWIRIQIHRPSGFRIQASYSNNLISYLWCGFGSGSADPLDSESKHHNVLYQVDIIPLMWIQIQIRRPPWFRTQASTVGIRIHMFLGLPDQDPDPLVRGADPDPSLFSNVLSRLKYEKFNLLDWRWCACGQVMRKN